MSVSESSSSTPFPQYRLKRKPPPTIDAAEKYPSPDPHDPFAPLWVLRNRTSSALGQKQLVTKDTPSPYSEPPIRTHQGPLMDTFKVNSASHSIPIERRRSNSYLLPHSTTNTTAHATPPRSSSTVPQSSNNGVRIIHTFNRRPSQSGSTTTGGGVSHPPMKSAHPQVNSDGTLRSNAMSRTDKRNGPQLVHPQAREPGVRRPTVDMRTSDNSSGNETESDLSVPAPGHSPHRVDVKVKAIDVESQGKQNNAGLTTTISFNVGVDAKPTFLQRVASNGTTSTGSASLARNVPPQQPMSQQSRLAKFLLPKKASHDGYMADGEKRKASQKGPVHKLSISAPLSDSFVHEGKSKSQQSKDDHNTTSFARSLSRSKGNHTSDTDLEEGTGGMRLRGVLFKTRKKASTDDTHVSAPSNSTPESVDPVNPMPAVGADKSKYPDSKDTQRRRPEMRAEVNIGEYCTNLRGSYPTPAPSPQLKPALELEQDGPLEGEQVKGSKLKSSGREVEEKRTNSGKGCAAEVKGQLETVGVSVSEIDANPVKKQASRVRKLKATNTPEPPSSFASTTPPTPIPPTPPPKSFKRRTSSSTHAQAEGTSNSSPNDPSQLPSAQPIVQSLISVPNPTELPSNEAEDASAFVRPRRAPRPPTTVEGVQSEPEPSKGERFDDLWKGSKEDKKQSRKDKPDGRMKSKPKSDDEDQVQKPRNMGATIKEMEVDTKPSSQHLSSVVKHGKASSTDLASRRDNPGVGQTEGPDGVSKKATVPVSRSIPAYLSSKESESVCLSQSQSRPPRGVSPDNSFKSFGFPLTEYSLPTRTQLSRASSLPVYAEDGRKHLFGSLFEKQKTVVIFIRHFWCPLCQDYMSVVKSTVTPDMIVAGGWIKAEEGEEEVVWKREKKRVAEVEKIALVVISNGAHAMIMKYRQIFSLPFRVYTDPSLAIYKLLGMGRTGTDCQDSQHSHPTNYLSDSPAPPMPKKKKHNYSLRRKADTSVSSLSDREQGGGYVKHGLMSGIAMVVARAFKVGMPVWEKGGDVGQLGGEFVFGPGLICTYAHKMQSSKGHAPIEEVLEAAGLKLKSPELLHRPSSPQALGPPPPATPKPESAQKRTNSVDLSSPPKPSKETRHAQEPLRNRRDSLKGLLETVSSPNRANTVTNATTIKSISHAQPLGSGQRGERDRRNDQSPNPMVASHKVIPPTLPPALKAVMTREEQARWADERQKSIERVIQDKGNNVRRLGALGRSPTSQGQGGAYTRSTQGNIMAKEGRGMTESRSAPMRSTDEEERIVYKAEGRRVQERTRGSDAHHGLGSGYVQRVSTSRVGHTATSSRR